MTDHTAKAFRETATIDQAFSALGADTQPPPRSSLKRLGAAGQGSCGQGSCGQGSCGQGSCGQGSCGRGNGHYPRPIL